MNAYGVSDIGLKRKINQDMFVICYNDKHDLIGIICDGIGGGKAGDVAAKMACDYMEQRFCNNPDLSSDSNVIAWIEECVFACNKWIFQTAKQNEDYAGMGTTMVGFIKVKEETYIFNAGDSRVYAMYDSLILLTQDHNLKEDLISAGEMSEEQALTHPHRNMLTNAIGIWEQNKVDIEKIRPGYSMLLLSSDGLHGLVSLQQIEKMIRNDMDLVSKANLLVESAKLHGGTDNITVILAKV
ncbi:MAG: protein phosphatase 2C domain-containing protein [Erysipelotrichaceae bacterium]